MFQRCFLGTTLDFNKDIASSETIIIARKKIKRHEAFCIYERPNEEGFWP